MKLSTPIQITSRLLPGLRIGNVELSITYSKRPCDNGRTRFQYFIDGPDFEHSDDDLQTGISGGGLQSGLESLLSFLSACGESVNYGTRTGHAGENADLFPEDVAQWAADNSDELVMLQYEIEETKGLIEE